MYKERPLHLGAPLFANKCHLSSFQFFLNFFKFGSAKSTCASIIKCSAIIRTLAMCLAAVYTAFGFTAASTSAGTLRQSVVISATCAFCMLAICKSCTVFEHVYDFVRRNDYKNTTNDSLQSVVVVVAKYSLRPASFFIGRGRNKYIQLVVTAEILFICRQPFFYSHKVVLIVLGSIYSYKFAKQITVGCAYFLR